MPWYAVRPRDSADPRWPLPDRPQVVLKAAGPDEARATFERAYPSEPFGTPASPVPDAGPGSFRGDGDGLIVEETGEPPSPAD
ncbi:hypothetical protein [Methylobacterium trifolii]|uniref:Uncharacterized protein n=1 Tax=Methylobacterium trifolii TaxID=1003092 RepID=A0ABQ4TXE6_9HYPH|nr:hypothetical protein [Methylobacterium trifolii]GJE59935.1 hypothetical protein MPOCJGCO_2042 [Methylobacterium trifolii]